MVMADAFKELRERVTFARSEIAVLQKEVHAFTATALTIRQIRTFKPNIYNYSIRLTKPVPTAVKSRAGTIANELRACLDGLACTLALKNTDNTNGTYFPISKTKAIFEDDGMRKIKKLSATDQQTIIALEPYKEKNPLLFGLHEADRTRKHISLCGCGGAQSTTFGGLIKLSSPIAARYENIRIDNVVVKDLAYTGDIASEGGNETILITGAPKELVLRFEGDLAYSDPEELRGSPMASTLSTFAGKVEEIIGLFDN